jgi:hypothetical protein
MLQEECLMHKKEFTVVSSPGRLVDPVFPLAITDTNTDSPLALELHLTKQEPEKGKVFFEI